MSTVSDKVVLQVFGESTVQDLHANLGQKPFRSAQIK